jgi:lipopolysaccharide export system permease protein
MGSIGNYVLRITAGAFLVVLISLTAVIWITQALRDIDLITNQRQTALAFIGITGLIIPQLVMVIAPLALVIAISHVLIRLSTDSELIVMSSAGMPPWKVFRPLLALTILVSLLVGANSAYIAPECLRMLRRWATEVRTDLITNIAQPGNFVSIDHGLTFHIRERRPNGQLLGILLDDRRDGRERVTLLAERGEFLKNEHGPFLLMENGSIQRHDLKQRDPNIVRFDRNAFDLSQFARGIAIRYSVRERYTWQLISPDLSDPNFVSRPAQYRAELHDRIVSMIYPFAFAIIAFAYLGAPRTTRQSRVWSVLGVIGLVGAVRLIGFASTVIGIQVPAFLILQYMAVFAALGFGIFAISRGLIIEPPARLVNAINALAARYARPSVAT